MTKDASAEKGVPAPRLVLASASPRRKTLLAQMGIEFEVLASAIDESIFADESVQQSVLRLAQEKGRAAQKILANNGKQSMAILAADTIVCQGDTIFAKPKDKDDAIRIWQKLSDAEHQVLTAVSLINEASETSCISKTLVRFDAISAEQMHRYWQTGEPRDKAGAYAIQGYASAWVQQLHGSYSNVVGLPLHEVNKLLKTIHLNWL